MHKAIITSILLFLLFLIPTTSTFGQKDSTRLKRFSSRRLAKKVVNSGLDYSKLSFKLDAKIETPTKTFNLNILFRNVKDSVIWINVNHNTGVPVARILLTKDSLKMLNRLENQYLMLANSKIIEKFNYDVTFDMLQSIFIGDLLNLEPQKEILQSYSSYKAYVDSTSYVLQNLKKKKKDRLVRKEKMDNYYFHQIAIDKDFKIDLMNLENNIKHQRIFVDYIEYNEEYNCPKRIELGLSNAQGETKITLKIKRIKIDPDKLGMSFKIPKKYTQVEL